MSVTVMLIVLLAALLHASWNFLVKQVEDKFLSMTALVIGHAPFAVLAVLYSPLPDPQSLPYLISGALLHVGYQLFLLNAYRVGDLSQVYPLARGISPLLVAGISVLWLGIDLTALELLAVITIGMGIMSLMLVRRRDGQRNIEAAFLALFTGIFIAAYSLVDGLGAREAGTALGFFGWLSLINSLIFALIMRLIKPGLVSEMVTKKWRLSVIGGGASFVAYAMVTWAFTQAPIALVTALRETSIVFALFFGVFFLKERLDLMKVFSTMLTLMGVVMLRINR